MKRAARTGPLAVMNEGTVFLAPSRVASATCGFATGFCGLVNPGLDPPIAGCAWHIAQLFPLNVGPSPLPASIVPVTESTSWKRRNAWLKKLFSFALSVGYGPPAPAGPGRG